MCLCVYIRVSIFSWWFDDGISPIMQCIVVFHRLLFI